MHNVVLFSNVSHWAENSAPLSLGAGPLCLMPRGVILHRLTFNGPVADLWSLSDGPLPSSGAKTPSCQTAQCDPGQNGTWTVTTMKMSLRLAHRWLSISVYTSNQLLAARTRPRTTPEDVGAEPEGET